MYMYICRYVCMYIYIYIYIYIYKNKKPKPKCAELSVNTFLFVTNISVVFHNLLQCESIKHFTQ